ncbi:hypothetical protein [Clavibacter zhangzhiyongii]|uniref:hypothetical protein n=1 Tax=Clavibacter zhangzhiyongii TaxID=2768071 RepID=UPI0019575075|nr:hypothetical protein [Clavibacter zhangzhiyongii]MBM7025042.1 hypothetical protein [Clavibacter zhangzhiyongii]
MYGMKLQGVQWLFDGRSAGAARLAAEARRTQEQIDRQGKVGQKLLALLKEHGPLTPAEAHALCGDDEKIQTVRNALNRLAFRNLASKDSAGHYTATYPPELGEFSELVGVAGNSANSGKQVRKAGASVRRRATSTTTKKARTRHE